MLEMKETIVAFAWEPKGSRFAVVHGEVNMSFLFPCFKRSIARWFVAI